MHNLFQNMVPFEAILLIMGIIAFLVLMFLLIWSVLKQRTVKSLLPFFLLPVVMVGYPSIKSIKIGDIILDINHYAEVVSEHPKDTVAREKLQKAITEVKSDNRFSHNEKALLAIANAHIVMGKYDSASLYLNKAEKLDPDSKNIKPVKNKLDDQVTLQSDFSQNIKILNKQIRQLKQSGDTQTLKKIVQTLSDVKIPPYAQPGEMITLAKSYAITNNKKGSLQIINAISKAEPVSQLNTELIKDSISKELYQKNYLKINTNSETIKLPHVFNKDILDKVVIKQN